MKSNMLKKIFIGLILFATSINVFAQEPTKWPEIPGLEHGGPITLTNEKIFIRVAGAAAVSYILAKYVLKSEEQGDFWQVRVSNAVGEYKTVFKQSIGVERHLAPWFAVALEFNFQQWFDNSPFAPSNANSGFGVGLQPYFRWYVFGKKRISPYLEYGTGFYQGFTKFPYNGTKFTFTHSSHLGIQYTIKNGNKLRLSYGQYHQSNNDWWSVNPSFNGNGFQITYSIKIK